jgi:hypothetical protein
MKTRFMKFILSFAGRFVKKISFCKGKNGLLFLPKRKSSQQSMTDKTASTAPNGDVGNHYIINQQKQKSNTSEKNFKKPATIFGCRFV